MALISCPKCGNTISEYSDVCPHCGHPIRKEKEKKRRAMYATLGTSAVIIAITAVVILLSFLAGRKKAAAPTSTPKTARYTVNIQPAPTSFNYSISPSQNYRANSAVGKRARALIAEKPYSYSGLVRQLRYEGFSLSDLLYGLSPDDFDWNEQAARKAQELVASGSYTRDALIEKLKSLSFSGKEAEYGADHCGQAWETLEI